MMEVLHQKQQQNRYNHLVDLQKNSNSPNLKKLRQNRYYQQPLLPNIEQSQSQQYQCIENNFTNIIESTQSSRNQQYQGNNNSNNNNNIPYMKEINGMQKTQEFRIRKSSKNNMNGANCLSNRNQQKNQLLQQQLQEAHQFMSQNNNNNNSKNKNNSNNKISQFAQNQQQTQNLDDYLQKLKQQNKYTSNNNNNKNLGRNRMSNSLQRKGSINSQQQQQKYDNEFISSGIQAKVHYVPKLESINRRRLVSDQYVQQQLQNQKTQQQQQKQQQQNQQIYNKQRSITTGHRSRRIVDLSKQNDIQQQIPLRKISKIQFLKNRKKKIGNLELENVDRFEKYQKLYGDSSSSDSDSDSDSSCNSLVN